MRGSGSLYPCSCAMRTAWLSFTSAESVLNTKLSVPLSTALMRSMRSPEARRSLMVLMMGRPAPTLVSKRYFTPRSRAVCLSVS